MKLAKMSLAAAMLLGVNAYAIDNVKVNGEAKVYYMTSDTTQGLGTHGTNDLFGSASSAADASLHLGVTADLTENVSAGLSFTAVSTLGLENNIVGNTWSSAHTVTTNAGAALGAQVDDAMWIDEMWVAATAMDTTVKLGRQQLDTPIVFTENWGVDTNTFEAAVLLNQSIDDTTLVAAYVGKSNGRANEAVAPTIAALGLAGYVAADGGFNSFYNGAYAIGAINNSWEPLTAQAWYYSVQGVADVTWLQADLNMEGVLAGVQYAVDDMEALSVMLGYEMKDVVTVKAAYSTVDDSSALAVQNIATGKESKLYTENWWARGNVGQKGADSYSVSAEATVAEIDLMAAYYATDHDDVLALDTDHSEIAFVASKDFGPLNTSLAVTLDDEDTAGDSTNVFIMLGYNF